MFTICYWENELEKFREAVANPATTEDALDLLTRGLVYLLSCTIKQNPTERDRLVLDGVELLAVLEARMGRSWLLAHIILDLTAHSSPT